MSDAILEMYSKSSLYLIGSVAFREDFQLNFCQNQPNLNIFVNYRQNTFMFLKN
jgi:hypothetical protein